MVEWRKLVNEFEDKDEIYDKVKEHMKYYRGLFQCAQHSPDQANPTSVLKSISGFALSWIEVTTLKGMSLIIKNPHGKWDFNAMLDKTWQPMASAVVMSSSMKSELEFLHSGEADLKAMAGKLHILEMSVAVSQDSDRFNDPALGDVKEPCQQFAKKYQQSLEKILGELHDSAICELDTFIDKYADVKEAASDWRMENFQGLLEADGAKEDFKRLHGAMTTVQKCLEELTPFTTHSSGHDTVKEIVKDVAKWIRLGKKGLYMGREVASVVMVSGFFLNQDAEMDIHTLLEHCHQMYGLKAQNLPGKLQKMASKALDDSNQNQKGETGNKKRKAAGVPSDSAPSDKTAKVKEEEEDQEMTPEEKKPVGKDKDADGKDKSKPSEKVKGKEKDKKDKKEKEKEKAAKKEKKGKDKDGKDGKAEKKVKKDKKTKWVSLQGEVQACSSWLCGFVLLAISIL